MAGTDKCGLCFLSTDASASGKVLMVVWLNFERMINQIKRGENFFMGNPAPSNWPF